MALPEKRHLEMDNYIMDAFELGFTCGAIWDDLRRIKYPDVPREVWIRYRQSIAKCHPRILDRDKYDESRLSLRFLIFNFEHIGTDADLFSKAADRGFQAIGTIQVIADFRTKHGKVLKDLEGGRRRDNEDWERAVVAAWNLGYSDHEIDYLSMQWTLERGLVSNLDSIQPILEPYTQSGGRQMCVREWEGNRAAQNYVVSAFRFGVPVAEIRLQLLVHGFKLYQITEKFLRTFLNKRLWA